jgi:G3E family GTPase
MRTMFRFESDTALQRVPVTVVAGARGTGKTTLANRIASAGAGPVAILANESGKVLPTANVVEMISGALVPHAVGCLCCVTRSGLVDALRRLYAAQTLRDDATPLRRVVVETAEGADPAPVMQTLLNNALVTQYFRLDGLITVLDARRSFDDLDAGGRCLEQVVMADRVVVTHGDVLPADRAAALEARLRRLAPLAGIQIASNSHDIDAAGLVGCSYPDRIAAGAGLSDWVGASLLDRGSGALEGGLHSFAISIGGPVEWDALHGWLNAGMRINGDVMHRVRAVLRVVGQRLPVVLECVRHVMRPPVLVAGDASGPERSLLHFVTRDLDRASVEASLREDLPHLVRVARERQQRQLRAMADPSLPA